MPYKYIGRTTDFKGKTLWEIVGNLKNYGVGRIVARSRWERYSEPSYIKILKVEPLPSPEQPSVDDVRKVKVLAERTFRGTTYPTPISIESASYKTDYKLIPKDEEDAYCKQNANSFPNKMKVYPKVMEFPPLLKEMLIKENKANGVSDEPKLEIVYNPNNYGKYRVAEEGETPDFQFNVGLGDRNNSMLYENIDKFKLSS